MAAAAVACAAVSATAVAALVAVYAAVLGVDMFKGSVKTVNFLLKLH